MSTTNYNYKVGFFTITAKSLLHVGAGGENFWIIDNLIQRDPTTQLPCIYASSLKGALREYMKDYLTVITNPDWIKKLCDIFCNDRSDFPDLSDVQLASALQVDPAQLKKQNFPGEFRFLQADLLSIPTHKDGYVEYKITSQWLKDNFREMMDLFNSELTFPVKLDEYIGTTNIAATDEEFCEMVDDYHLPVIARNHLENGSSTNLWYEQVLPRGTKLFFAVLYENQELFEVFKTSVTSNPVQIGANASVGYGFCKIEFIETKFKD